MAAGAQATEPPPDFVYYILLSTDITYSLGGSTSRIAHIIIMSLGSFTAASQRNG